MYFHGGKFGLGRLVRVTPAPARVAACRGGSAGFPTLYVLASRVSGRELARVASEDAACYSRAAQIYQQVRALPCGLSGTPSARDRSRRGCDGPAVCAGVGARRSPRPARARRSLSRGSSERQDADGRCTRVDTIPVPRCPSPLPGQRWGDG
jgi:hypothetical protein